ncbi:monovalent cation:proton antiporter family protein [Hymenobacter latericus]|uniref:monovalent cation:proton antiporter family protein n=1 Tax=Hymenobacter sp. YIM 151858-1 TaxID=2987688 RepID=UPI002226F9D1|nr:monovalent cation:proton antiporter family protein [Hymenobacter sp. YIM 151858-1]UYZ57656.1 cation:proton antiporter [Hymenobacter sp. YIM 151858-1]
MHVPMLSDLLVILLLSVGVILLFNRIKLPSIIGYLVTGMVAGPYALALVQAPAKVNQLAELGVMLLMFIIGLEFSLHSLSRMKRAVFLGGALQVGLTIAAVYVLARGMGSPPATAVFWGFLIALSSTAIVLKLLQDQLQVDSVHGQVVLAILIFQDLIVVPMMLLVPLLSGQITGSPWLTLSIMLAKMLGVLLLVVVGAKFLMPRLLLLVARTRSRELFLLTIIGTCIGVAWLTAEAGLSMALGAFLAGLIISESEYSYEAVSNVMPFREIFASFFFVSIGMLFDVHVLLEHPLRILVLTVGVMSLKVLLTPAAAAFLRVPVRAVLLAGLALCQVGEFSFILSLAGLEAGLISHESYQLFLAISILTMCLTPVVMLVAEPVVSRMMRMPLPEVVKDYLHPEPTEAEPTTSLGENVLENHLVVIGYGLNGRNLVRAAKHAHIPYVIIDTDADTVHRQLKRGEPILFGDATHAHVLEHAHIQRARVVVIAISDPAGSLRVVAAVRRLNPEACIIVRSLYLYERKELYQLGATEVIAEEMETSIEILARVLARYLVPLHEIDALIRQLRGGNIVRSRSLTDLEWSGMHVGLAGLELATVPVPDQAALVGKTLSESEMRQHYGVNLLAIRRNGHMLNDMCPDTVIHGHDTLYVFGKPDQVERLAHELQPEEEFA